MRQRRQRRRALQAALALGVLAFGLAWLRPWRSPAARPGERERGGVAQATAWTSFDDDPTVVSRREAATAVRAEWFLDDAGLERLLAAAARPSGIVRAGGQVFVAAAAIDAWQADGP